MKALILTCIVLISFQVSEACFSKKSSPPPKVSSGSGGGGRTDSTSQESVATGNSKTPKPVMPTIAGCFQAGFPGSPEYNQCVNQFRQDMIEYKKKMDAWNLENGIDTGNEGEGDFASNTITYNGWKIKTVGGRSSVNTNNGAVRINIGADGRVDKVKADPAGTNTMKWSFLRNDKLVGWVKVNPPTGIDVNGLKYQFSDGTLSIWQQ